MEMNKLKPLVWKDLDEDPMLVPVSVSESPLHHYVVLKDGDKFMVRYSERYNDFDYATGFDSLEAGKEWAWKHYQEKMSFYFTENTDIKYMAWDKYDNVLLDVEELYPPFTASSGKHITVMIRGDLEWRSIDEVVLLEVSKLNKGDSNE